MKLNPQKLLDRAERIAKQGNVNEAKKLYSSVLKSYPKSIRAIKGLKSLEINKISDSKQEISREEINSVYALYTEGMIEEAIDKIQILNKDFPDVPLLFNILGACYNSLEQLDNAAKAFKTAVAIKPDYAEAHYNTGVVLKALGRLEEAVESYRKAIVIIPNYPDAHNNLGITLKQLGQIEAAIESFEWAIAYKPENAQSHNNLGNALKELGRLDAAIDSYHKAISFDFNFAEPYNNLGDALKELGRLDEAVESYEKALEIKPDFVESYLELSRIKKYKKNDLQIANMISLLGNKNISLIDRIGLNFALAHVNEGLKNQDDQFKYLNEANRLRKKELNYSFEKDQKLFARIRDVFKTPLLIKQSSLSQKNNSLTPIFILGMPRSGTSLVEQILDSHNKVHGAGELNVLNKFIFPLLNDSNYDENNSFSEKVLVSMRQNYLDSLINLNVREKNIIDKMPLNFRYIGFILTVFPEAKIIHLKRDAMATCWSIYKYYFNGNEYSYNLKDLANYYVLYKEIMSFWHQLFPNKIYDMSYENLTINQEEETQKLLQYCELEWDKNCLNFHNNKRAVKTTSTFQVRKRIYQGSSEAWKKHKAYLKPLTKRLDSI